MTRGIFSNMAEQIARETNEAKSKDYEMVNVRPGEKVSSMLTLLAHLTGKTPSVIIANALSEKIAIHAANSPEATDAIMEAAEMAIKECGWLGDGSALSLLAKEGIINISTPFSLKFREQFRKD